MKIREYIISKELEVTTTRLEALIKMGAPQIIINNLSKEVKKLKNGTLKIGSAAGINPEDLLNQNFDEVNIKQGRGGKIYIQFDGKINYFPHAKYGKYISITS